MKIYQKITATVASAVFVFPLIIGNLVADTTTTTVTHEIPIPNGNQIINGEPPDTVDAIVTDNEGNMTEEQLPYNPQTQTVIVNNNYGGDNASIFFPLFETGFMFYAGYWVGQNGYFWNGSGYGYVNHGYWNNHWNNYWRHDWAPRWNHYSHNHSKYHNHGKNWHDHAGHWHGHGGHGGGGHHGGGGGGGHHGGGGGGGHHGGGGGGGHHGGGGGGGSRH